jgi:hypothetical protein
MLLVALQQSIARPHSIFLLPGRLACTFAAKRHTAPVARTGRVAVRCLLPTLDHANAGIAGILDLGALKSPLGEVVRSRTGERNKGEEGNDSRGVMHVDLIEVFEKLRPCRMWLLWRW